MARYIDADTLKQRISLHSTIQRVIDSIPAADVRPERHGKNTTEMNSVDEFVCSECGFIMRETSGYDKEEDVYYEFNLKYCPNCGAKMDGKEESG